MAGGRDRDHPAQERMLAEAPSGQAKRNGHISNLRSPEEKGS
ncbi:hypothetical protein SF83666_d70100 (plasmid) [Sinorhizobium fredii CCBAU 83666]|nr:hypothetical protein SF83666_d70100 [Sinorhizobium fredii CCBAU 83666]